MDGTNLGILTLIPVVSFFSACSADKEMYNEYYPFRSIGIFAVL